MSEIFVGCRGGGGGIAPGCIVIWSGASNAIPTGWALCDGTNGTPDLRNRFVVGAGSGYSVGSTGGSNSISLNISQLPSHGHSLSGLSTGSSGNHTHSISMNSSNSLYVSGTWSCYGAHTSTSQSAHSVLQTSSNASLSKINSAGSHTHSISGSLSNTGSGYSHENRPPYYALCYIMKL